MAGRAQLLVQTPEGQAAALVSPAASAAMLRAIPRRRVPKASGQPGEFPDLHVTLEYGKPEGLWLVQVLGWAVQAQI